MNFWLTFAVLIGCITNISCLKLLLVFPAPSKSHYILGSALGKGLAKAGHEVTIISAYSEKDPPKNYTEIVLPEMLNRPQGSKINMYDRENIPTLVQLYVFNHISNIMSTKFFETPKVQTLLKSNGHFDAVIVEQFLNDAMKIFAHHFQAPLIVFSTVGPNVLVNNLVANPEPPSYVPNIMLSFTGDMNFFQRTYNLIYGLLLDVYFYCISLPQQNAIMKKYYPNAPHLSQLQYNVSLVLTNSHESISNAVPHVPNMIDIGGFHVDSPKELPKDLKQFMDNAKDGVIYFSMGSNLVPSDMPKEKKDVILKVLGSRKEKVLWKWDEDTLVDKPDNFMISKWFPQQSILAHENCKLFISHGGLLSTIETVYLGVPILAFPIFGDQKQNAAEAAALGYGKTIPFSQINEHDLGEMVNEMLNNPRYRENAKLRSRIMHDRPVKPIDLATYWIEYVVRHKGAPHLRVAGINLPLYKYYMLDVIGVGFTILVLVIYLLSKVCSCIKYKLKGTGPNKKSKKKRE